MEVTSGSSYCRLCAGLKRNKDLNDLTVDEERRRTTVAKLGRVNVMVDLEHEILPKTVCWKCLNALERAVEFVRNCEQAQGALKVIFKQQVFKEEPVSDIERVSDSSEVLNEFDSDDSNEIPSSNSPELNFDVKPIINSELSWSDYNWICAYCNTKFDNIDQLQSHSIESHNCCNAYRCMDCNKCRLQLHSFLIHVRTHNKDLKLLCHKCNLRLSSERAVALHKKTHFSTEFVCPGCHVSFSSDSELEVHKNQYYNIKISKVPNEMRIKESLNSSLSTDITSTKRNYTCEVCGKNFQNIHTLTEHIKSHTDHRPFKCEICSNSYRTAAILRNHVLAVHDEHKPFSCETCGRSFSKKNQLKVHFLTHIDDLPHSCAICKKSFRLKAYLSRHMRQHTGEKPYECEHCQRSFTNRSNYAKHMRCKHNFEMVKKKRRNSGEVSVNKHLETAEVIEWKKKLLQLVKRGQPSFSNNDHGHS